MKGFSGTWNVIIAAVIGVVILAIIVFLVINKVSEYDEGAGGCEAKGGVCSEACDYDNGLVFVPFDCPKEETPVCCMPQGLK